MNTDLRTHRQYNKLWSENQNTVIIVRKKGGDYKDISLILINGSLCGNSQTHAGPL